MALPEQLEDWDKVIKKREQEMRDKIAEIDTNLFTS